MAARKAKVERYAAFRPRQPEFQRVYTSSMYTAYISSESTILGSRK